MTVKELESSHLWSIVENQVDNEFTSGEHADAYVQQFFHEPDGSKPACRVFVKAEFAAELARYFGWTLTEKVLPLSGARVLIAYGSVLQIEKQLFPVKELGKLYSP